jgi:DNA-binding NarL/FixJ family response regulator
MNGLEATRRITSEMPDILVIGLSMHAKEEMSAQMIAAGAKGYLEKDSPIEEIISVICEVTHKCQYAG